MRNRELSERNAELDAFAHMVAHDLRNLESKSAVSARIAATAPWLAIVKFGTPAIFTLTYIAILMQLFLGYMRY